MACVIKHYCKEINEFQFVERTLFVIVVVYFVFLTNLALQINRPYDLCKVITVC